MQVPDKESAGRAQLVKSARIWSSAFAEVDPHKSGVEAISASLVAYSAYEMLASGRDTNSCRD